MPAHEWSVHPPMFTAAIPVAAVMARVSEYRLPLTLMISFSRTDFPVPEIGYGAC